VPAAGPAGGAHASSEEGKAGRRVASDGAHDSACGGGNNGGGDARGGASGYDRTHDALIGGSGGLKGVEAERWSSHG
jgi:hypothetical protein